MKERKNRLFLVNVLAVLGIVSIAGLAQAQADYTYTVIADVTNCFNINAPVLNDNGEVAFGANCGTPLGDGSPGIYRGDGGSVTTIFRVGTGQIAMQSLVSSINDAGTVVFDGFGVTSGSVPSYLIMAGNGGPVQILVDTEVHTQFEQVWRPSINNAGDVAFSATTEGAAGNPSVVVLANGAFTTIAGPGTASPLGSLAGASEPSLNNEGIAVFFGNISSSSTPSGLFTGWGRPLTLITSDTPNVFNGINDQGRVAFVAASAAVQIADGTVTTTVATTSAGGYQGFPAGGAAINNLNQVVFTAELPGGQWGVFTGPDPVADAVARPGDNLPGLGLVRGAVSSRESMNNHGEIAFVVFYDPGDGSTRAAMIRAEPNGGATATTLNGSASAVVFGEAVTLTAGVDSTTGSPTGEVEFFDGLSSLGTALLNGGTAVLQTKDLSVGNHSLSASYQGDGTFSPSESSTIALTVSKAQTTTTVSSSPNPSQRRQTVTFSVQVAPVGPGSGTPTGQVQIRKGKKLLGTANVVNGTGTVTLSFAQAGTQTLSAVYAGDGKFVGSTSAPYTHTVSR